MLKDNSDSSRDIRPPAFYRVGTSSSEDFIAALSTQTFDVVNDSSEHMLLLFEANENVTVSPSIFRLAPSARATVQLTVAADVAPCELRYAVSRSRVGFQSHADRYRAKSDGESVMCVPVAPALHTAMLSRAKAILDESMARVTDPQMSSDTFIYTPGPFYKAAGLFPRDLLYQLEGAGRYIGTADEVKRAVDFLALKQLRTNRKIGAYTYPRGAIPDHVYPDGRYCWGPGAFYGDDTAHFNRPSMDASMCFITLGWHYGHMANWDADWQAWFTTIAAQFADAWNSAPRNPKTGLVTQWTTAGHIGGSDITETDGACVMWGFHDSYGFGGDDIGTSVLACNAARALADMHEHTPSSSAAQTWSAAADAMRDAIREQCNPAGYLPWGVGDAAPSMASPDITGYAVWSGILSDAQADAASDWFAARYRTDHASGGAADLFHMSPGFRGAVRMARKADDSAPGRHVWPDMRSPEWENLTYGYNAYQDGGYWYYMSLGIAATLWRKHPDLATEWVTNTYADIINGGDDNPYERIDGMTPENNRYNASIGPVLGMGLPATVYTLDVRGNAPHTTQSH